MGKKQLEKVRMSFILSDFYHSGKKEEQEPVE